MLWKYFILSPYDRNKKTIKIWECNFPKNMNRFLALIWFGSILNTSIKYPYNTSGSIIGWLYLFKI